MMATPEPIPYHPPQPPLDPHLRTSDELLAGPPRSSPAPMRRLAGSSAPKSAKSSGGR